MSRAVVIATGTPSGMRVRIDSCPVCRRSIRLDHAGRTDDEGDWLDLGAVQLAQRLHLAQCQG